MASCARPTCSEPVAGLILLHRADRVAELLPVGDLLGERYGSGLCAEHLGRMKAPKGWELVDRRAGDPRSAEETTRPRIHGAPGSATNPSKPLWLPRGRPGADEMAELGTVSSPLLRRAFLGSADAGDGVRAEAESEADAGPDDGQVVGQLRLSV